MSIIGARSKEYRRKGIWEEDIEAWLGRHWSISPAASLALRKWQISFGQQGRASVESAALSLLPGALVSVRCGGVTSFAAVMGEFLVLLVSKSAGCLPWLWLWPILPYPRSRPPSFHLHFFALLHPLSHVVTLPSPASTAAFWPSIPCPLHHHPRHCDHDNSSTASRSILKRIEGLHLHKLLSSLRSTSSRR
jgi:hypothetical protein